MTIGQRIKQTRIDKKMTMDELGKAIGVQRATISRYESGEISVSGPKVEAIAEVLGVTPGYLMGWVEHPDQLTLVDMPGVSVKEREAWYNSRLDDDSQKPDKRRELVALVNSVPEDEIDLISQLIISVIKNRK